jgi:hypothetical protein
MVIGYRYSLLIPGLFSLLRLKKVARTWQSWRSLRVLGFPALAGSGFGCQQTQMLTPDT